MGTHHPLQLLLVAAAAAAAAEVVVVRNTGQKYYAAAAAAAEVVVVRNTGQKYYSLARSPLRLPGSADTSGGSKSRLATAAGAEPFGGMRDQKLHVVVVRSKFGSQNGKNTSALEHFWSWSS